MKSRPIFVCPFKWKNCRFCPYRVICYDKERKKMEVVKTPIHEVDIEIFETKCPKCGKTIYGGSKWDLQNRLVEHLNKHH